MSLYSLTRQEASDLLNISTRSTDRYIKSGKLRSEKRWKIVYVHEWDVKNIAWGGSKPQVVISDAHKNISSQSVAHPWNSLALDSVYSDMRQEIAKKDELITDLSIRVWRAEEIAKNSISLVDFKKSQFLLEESKSHLWKEVEYLADKKTTLEKELKYEKNTNLILIVFVILLLIASATIWFIKI